MVGPINSLVNDPWHVWHVVVSALGGATAGVTAQKWINKIVESMPPCPADANFWQKWGYSFLKTWADTEPSKWDGSDRRGAK